MQNSSKGKGMDRSSHHGNWLDLRGIRSALLALMVLAIAGAKAEVVADYGADFQTGAPAAGWAYLWNANGPIGTAANYAPLVHDAAGSGFYESQANGAWPDAAPGAYVRANSTTVYPGQSASQDGSGIQRYVIMAYTFSPAEVAAHGPSLLFHTYNFNIPADVPGNIDVWAYKNDVPIFTYPGGFPPSTQFSDGIYGGDYDFGTVQAGDTLYLALGAQGDYAGQPLSVAFTLALVPEPGVLGMLSLLPALLARRRGRRC